MGCDIHMHTFQQIGASWFCIDGRYMDPYEHELKYRRTFHQRNYQLFSALADVRNSWGIKPIAEPRELPRWVLALPDREMYDFGDHSQTWLTADEIIHWKGWTQTVEDERLVDEENFKLYQKRGPKGLKSWCRDSSGPKFTYDQREEFIASQEKWKHIWVPAKAELQEMWGIADFLSMVRYDLAYISKHWDHPKDIVLVFGFDS